jgi:hypothetical protein
MTDDSPLAFSLPAVSRKKITAAFDGGRLSSDSGVVLLSLAERRQAIARTLAALFDDPRDPAHITHTIEDVLRAANPRQCLERRTVPAGKGRRIPAESQQPSFEPYRFLIGKCFKVCGGVPQHFPKERLNRNFAP